jgi:hypothetical protein
MDRKNPQLVKLQENFINVLVGSLFRSYLSSGLLPGTFINQSNQLLSEVGDSKRSYNSSREDLSHSSKYHDELSKFFVLFCISNSSLNDLIIRFCLDLRGIHNGKIFYSELIENFESNYQMWYDRLKQEQLQQQQQP